jgi:hypothetical protein
VHTSVRLSDDLDKQVHLILRERGMSLTSFLQSAIRNEIQRHEIADLEKRISASFGTVGKKIDKAAEANRAGFALFLALTEELLSHIYVDRTTADAQLQNVIRAAQMNFTGTVKNFLGETDGK